MGSGIEIRAASSADAVALAKLRWTWAPPHVAPRPEDLDEFASSLRQWMILRREESVCTIALVDGELVGMAWLAIFDRVPNPDDLERRSGDVQSVFVLPEYRGRGLGARLVRSICNAADELGIDRITVQANDKAVPFYERIGFSRSNLLLQRDSNKG